MGFKPNFKSSLFNCSKVSYILSIQFSFIIVANAIAVDLTFQSVVHINVSNASLKLLSL